MALAALKITEAITILRAIDKNVDGILTNFETPGKIDLAKFMEGTLCLICLWKSLAISQGVVFQLLTATFEKLLTPLLKNGLRRKGWNWRIIK